MDAVNAACLIDCHRMDLQNVLSGEIFHELFSCQCFQILAVAVYEIEGQLSYLLLPFRHSFGTDWDCYLVAGTQTELFESSFRDYDIGIADFKYFLSHCDFIIYILIDSVKPNFPFSSLPCSGFLPPPDFLWFERKPKPPYKAVLIKYNYLNSNK